jgi:copper chaperone
VPNHFIVIMETVVNVNNLKCGGCAATIRNNLINLEHIKEVVVNPATSSVTLTHNHPIDNDIVREVMAKIGYPLVGDDNSILQKAKSYVSCAVGRFG